MGKKKKNEQKTTNLSVSVEFENGLHPAKASVKQNGDFIFFDENGNEIKPSRMKREMHHDRMKGPKIRTSQVLEHGKGAISGLQPLAEYDVIFAIDTNTADVSGKRVSVAGFMPFSLVPADEGYTIKNHENQVQIYEFEGAPRKPELLAIWKLVLDLTKHGGIGLGSRVAIVTDTELGSLDDLNAREKPIYANHFLPEGFTLLYASSDTGWEVLNKFIRICDKAAEHTIKERRAGDSPEAPFVPLEDISSVKVRVGHRNAVLTVENSTVADTMLRPGQMVSLHGLQKKP